MPIPPPPERLFNITGYPMSSATMSAWSRSRSPSLPANRGTPAARANSRAAFFARERFEIVGRRPDPRHARGFARPREPGVLRQEAVAGVQRVGTGVRGCAKEAFAVEVALPGRGWAEPDRFVREPNVRRVPVGVGIHGHRRDPECAQRAQDPDGDLAPVGDDHLRHGHVGPSPSHTRSRIGVGFQPLHGLLSWGQFEITNNTSRSARSST